MANMADFFNLLASISKFNIIYIESMAPYHVEFMAPYDQNMFFVSLILKHPLLIIFLISFIKANHNQQIYPNKKVYYSSVNLYGYDIITDKNLVHLHNGSNTITLNPKTMLHYPTDVDGNVIKSKWRELENGQCLQLNVVKKLCDNKQCQYFGASDYKKSKYCGILARLIDCPMSGKKPCKKGDMAPLFTMLQENKNLPNIAIHAICQSIYPDIIGSLSKIAAIGFSTSRNHNDLLHAVFYTDFGKNITNEISYSICSFKTDKLKSKLMDRSADITVFDEKTMTWYNTTIRQLANDNVGYLHEKLISITEKGWFNYKSSSNNETTAITILSDVEDVYGLAYDYFFIGTSQGDVIRISSNFEGVNISLPIWPKVANKAINKMKIWEWQHERLLILLTNTTVVSLPLHYCEPFNSCPKCVRLQDPLCGWLDEKECFGIMYANKSILSEIRQDVKDGNYISACRSDSDYERQRDKEELTNLRNEVAELKDKVKELKNQQKVTEAKSQTKGRKKHEPTTIKTIPKIEDNQKIPRVTEDNSNFWTHFFAAAFLIMLVIAIFIYSMRPPPERIYERIQTIVVRDALVQTDDTQFRSSKGIKDGKKVEQKADNNNIKENTAIENEYTPLPEETN